MIGICGIFSVIPASVLLAISFFVFLSLNKLEDGALKSFGRITGLLLCVASVFVFSMGLYLISSSKCEIMKGKYHSGMVSKMKEMKMCQKMSEAKTSRMSALDPSPVYIENNPQPTPVHIHISNK